MVTLEDVETFVPGSFPLQLVGSSKACRKPEGFGSGGMVKHAGTPRLIME